MRSPSGENDDNEKKVEKKTKEEGDSIIFHSTVYRRGHASVILVWGGFKLTKIKKTRSKIKSALLIDYDTC